MRTKLLIFVLTFFMFDFLQAADFNILKFGATLGQLSTAAIQKAVDEC